MKYRNAAGFRTALEQRLANVNQQTNLSIGRLRKTVVFDRLLARLFASAPERWVLKGGLALDFRFQSAGRATKDIDLVRRDNEAAATEDLIAAQVTDLHDYFEFSIERVERRDEEQEGSAVRYRARAELAGRLFDEILIDIGFTDPLQWAPEILTGPNLLSFADIEPIRFPALQIEQHVAEKLHSYTRTYGGYQSSRAKDLIDLVLIKSYLNLDGERLREALKTTFRTREMQDLPDSVPSPPAAWEVPYRKMALEVGIESALARGHREAQLLLDPILRNERQIRWNASQQQWQARAD